MDDLIFDWKIRRLGTKENCDEVSRVYWTIIGRKDDHSHSISGFTDLPKYDPSQGKSFIPYDKLNHDIVTKWIEEHIGPILDGYRALISKNLDSDLKKTLISKVPMWD